MDFAGVDFVSCHGFAVGDVNCPAEFRKLIVAAKGFESSEQSCWNHRSFGLTGDHSGSGFWFGKSAGRRTCALGVNCYCALVFK